MLARTIGILLLRNIWFGVCVASLIMFGWSMLHNAYTPDLPWILASGDYILAHHRLPAHDIFSWTFPDKPWVLYQWLFEVLTAGLQSILGTGLLMKLFILSTAGLYIALPSWWGRRHAVPAGILMLVTSASLYMAAVNLSLRPMVATTLFLALQYVAVELYREKRLSFKRLLLLLAVFYLLWGNMHTGVVLGLVALVLMGIGDFIQGCGWYRYEPIDSIRAGQPVAWRCYAAMALTGFLASLINPYGWGIYDYLANLSAQQGLNTIIMELQSPNFHMLNYVYFVAFLALIMLLLTRMRQVFQLGDFLLVIGFTLATLFVQRFVVWAALFDALILPQALYRAWQGWRAGAPQAIGFLQQLEIYRPLFLILFTVGAVGLLVYPQARLPRQAGLCDKWIPGLTVLHEKRQTADRVFTEPEVGSCVLVKYPDDKVFIDTRFDFYQETFTQAVKSTTSLDKDWQAFLKKWSLNMIVISKQWPLAFWLLEQPGYEKIYDDEAMMIFRKKANRL